MSAPDVFVPVIGAIGHFLDIGATLLDPAPTPNFAALSQFLLDDLAIAERRLDGALALINGRPIEQPDRLFAPLRLPESGVHGAEIISSPREPTRSLTMDRLSAQGVRSAALGRLDEASEMFVYPLGLRNAFGRLSENIRPATGASRSTIPLTCSMAAFHRFGNATFREM